MTRRESALLEIVKRGGTINERKIACEKLMLLTGKNYSHLLPKEKIKKPENELSVTTDFSNTTDFSKFIEQIKNNFPFSFDPCRDLWRGSNGLIIYTEQLHDVRHYFGCQELKKILTANS